MLRLNALETAASNHWAAELRRKNGNSKKSFQKVNNTVRFAVKTVTDMPLQLRRGKTLFGERNDMNLSLKLALSLALLTSISTSAMAAATEEEATRLTKVLQTYLTDKEGVVSVEANGDDYDLVIDIAPLTAGITDGTTVKLTPLEFTLTDKGGGKWEVNEDQPITLNLDIKDTLSVEEKVESVIFSGVFDEAMGAFASADAEYKNFVVSEKVTNPDGTKSDIGVTLKSMTVSQLANAAANGGADIIAKIAMDGLSENIAMAADPTKAMPAMNIVLTAENGNADLTIKGTKIKSIFDLTAFFIAHQSKEAIQKDAAALKAILTGGLPLWESVEETGKLNKVTAATAFGQFAMDSVDFGLGATGAVKDGKLSERIGVNGLVVPAAIVPPWATQLVPKNFNFDFTVSNFDLATPANMILSTLDLSKDNPLPDGFEQLLMPAFMPTGSVKVTLNPTSVNNDTYTFSAEGSMVAGPSAMPTGQATVKAKGLDELLKIVTQAPPEAGLQQGAAVIIAAKGLGKAEADGSLSWKIESAPGGKFLVNGIDPSTIH